MIHKIGIENITSVGDAIKEVMPVFERMAEKTTKFAEGLRESLASRQPETCDDHPDTELPVDFERTFSESWFSKKTVVVYSTCPKCIEDRKKLLVNEKMKKMGIPHRVIHATFENFKIQTPSHQNAFKKATSQAERGRGFLILRGTVGTGKSHLGAAILKHSGKGIFTTLADLIGELRKTYDEGGQEIMVSRYRDAHCFVLDELTKDVKGSDVSTILYRILAHRYDRGSLTVITSNDNLSDILDVLGPKLTDRIKEDYRVATMEWDSHRKGANP
jgi:DNA replication protein DnaC